MSNELSKSCNRILEDTPERIQVEGLIKMELKAASEVGKAFIDRQSTKNTFMYIRIFACVGGIQNPIEGLILYVLEGAEKVGGFLFLILL